MKRVGTCLLSVVTLAVVAGCSHNTQLDKELGWPPPPSEPRIVYRQSLYGSQNLSRSFFGRFKDFLFGRSPDMDIDKPYGIVYDGDSKLYIADTGKKGILALDFAAGKARFFNSLGAHGKLGEPVNVILDKSGNIYVADTKLGKVVVFSKDGKFSHFIGADGELESPVGMAILNERSRLYVVDSKRHQVKIFTLEGACIGTFGQRGDQQGEFYHPLGIAISEGDTIYIVDSFHFAVQAFDLNGEYLFSFGPRQDGIGSMARPRAIAIDSDNNLYVTDALNDNIQMYNSRGELLMTFGAVGLSPGKFRLPAGICITDDDRIYIADSINRRIQEFQYLAER